MVNSNYYLITCTVEFGKGLVTNYGEGGGYKTGGGGVVKLYPYKKRCGKSFNHAEGGATKILR